jgi:ribose-phosphate pyrophosphokinase
VDKRRPDLNQAEVMHIIGDVDGKNVVIRDDMVDTAGTLTEAAFALKEKGAKRIIAVCTHGVLSGQALKKIEDSPIEKLYISDTIQHDRAKLSSKFEILSVSEIFSEAILRIHEERSLSSLFK